MRAKQSTIRPRLAHPDPFHRPVFRSWRSGWLQPPKLATQFFIASQRTGESINNHRERFAALTYCLCSPRKRSTILGSIGSTGSV